MKKKINWTLIGIILSILGTTGTIFSIFYALSVAKSQNISTKLQNENSFLEYFENSYSCVLKINDVITNFLNKKAGINTDIFDTSCFNLKQMKNFSINDFYKWRLINVALNKYIEDIERLDYWIEHFESSPAPDIIGYVFIFKTIIDDTKNDYKNVKYYVDFERNKPKGTEYNTEKERADEKI